MKACRMKQHSFLCTALQAILLCIALLGAGGMGVSAAEAPSLEGQIIEKSGLEGLYDSLDKGTQALLSQAGAEGIGAGGLDSSRLFQALGNLVRDKLTGPLKACAAFVAIAVLCKLAGCFGDEGPEGAAGMAGGLACAAVAVPAVWGAVSGCGVVAESASAFLLAAVPAYSALLAVSGGAAASGGYSFLTLGAGNLIPLLCTGLVLPLLRIFLALAVSSCVSGTKLGKLTASLYSLGKWLLVLGATLFSGVLSVQTILNTHMDAAASKTAKLIASSAIPIVGGTLGDAIGAIQSSVEVVRSGAGAFGMLAALCIFAPSMAEAALWAAACTMGQTAGDICGAPGVSALLGACTSVVKMVLAVQASLCVVCLTCAGVVLFTKGG